MSDLNVTRVIRRYFPIGPKIMPKLTVKTIDSLTNLQTDPKLRENPPIMKRVISSGVDIKHQLVTKCQNNLNEPPQSSSLESSKQSTTKQPTVIKEEPDYVLCPECPRIFLRLPDMQEHVKKIHLPKNLTPKKSSAPPTPAPTTRWECDMCTKVYTSRHRLNSHRKTHNPERPYKCQMCNKAFKLRGQLNEHARIHSGAKRHSCDCCDYATSNKTVLRYHKNRFHNLGLDYVCEHCGKKYPSPPELNNHLDTHKDKAFECKVCQKGYPTQAKLNHHEATHNPNRPRFDCEKCSTSYMYKTGLRKHMLLCHAGSGPTKYTKYTCEFCGKNVSSAETLADHRRTHTGEKPFGCDVCYKAFNSKKYLVIHQRIHTGEKPFKCTKCEKAFSQRGTLTIHMRLHMGIKPYGCDICSKAFVTRTLLAAHEKTSHGAVQ